jgi:S-adenosylmethionine uptake transporter
VTADTSTATLAAGPAPAGLAENMRSSVYMMLSMAGFTCNDALLKTVSGELPLFQAVFLRGAFATALIGCLAWQQGALRFRFRRRDGGLVGMRLVAEIGGTAFFLTALFNMPFANANAIIQSVPLAVTLGAALFLGEPVGWRRYLAIAVGFAGVLIIVRPGSEGFNGDALLAVAAIAFIVTRDLVTRCLSPDVPALAVVFVTGSGVTLAAGIAAAFDAWRPVEIDHLVRLASGAACLVVGYVFGVMSIRTGDISFVAPFRYTLLLWAILFGIVLFDEWPDAWVLAGSAVVVGSGIYTFSRERRLAREALSGVSSRR